MKRILLFVILTVFNCESREQLPRKMDSSTTFVQDADRPNDKTEDVGVDKYVLTGIWQGIIDIETETMTVFVTITETDNEYSATIDIPTGGAFGISFTEVKADGNAVELGSDELGGEFRGEIDSNGNLVGVWYQNERPIPVSLERRTEPVDYSRPQDPVEPYPYTVREMQFINAKAVIELAGTLTIPKDMEDYPLVILITGSGPQNRDEELMNHRPFLVIADYLTRHGIAVFRYDDRGVGESQGDFSGATSADFIDDGAAAVEYVLADKTLDIAVIGLMGHSEGAMIAPVVAVENSSINFVVMLAGSVYSGEQILYQQNEAILIAQGYSETAMRQNSDTLAQVYQIVKDNPNDSQAEKKLRELFPTIGVTDDQVETNLSRLLSPWFRYFLTFEPRSALEKLQIPVFAVNGALDLQVVADKNLQAIQDALEKAGNTQYEIKKYEGLNHLFQHANTGLPSEYAEIEETFSEEVLADLVQWIRLQ